jgi:hypothetical protein
MSLICYIEMLLTVFINSESSWLMNTRQFWGLLCFLFLKEGGILG